MGIPKTDIASIIHWEIGTLKIHAYLNKVVVLYFTISLKDQLFNFVIIMANGIQTHIRLIAFMANISYNIS